MLPWILSRKWICCNFEQFSRQNIWTAWWNQCNGDECFRITETLFYPSIMGMECAGTPKALHTSLMKCNVDVCRTFSPNFHSLCSQQMTDYKKSSLLFFNQGMIAKVVTWNRNDRNNCVWIGGSLLASLSTFQEMWIYKQHYYEEFGLSIANRKYIL